MIFTLSILFTVGQQSNIQSMVIKQYTFQIYVSKQEVVQNNQINTFQTKYIIRHLEDCDNIEETSGTLIELYDQYCPTVALGTCCCGIVCELDGECSGTPKTWCSAIANDEWIIAVAVIGSLAIFAIIVIWMMYRYQQRSLAAYEKRTEEQNCKLCQEKIMPSDQLQLNCPEKHVFHQKCVPESLEIDKICPECKMAIF